MIELTGDMEVRSFFMLKKRPTCSNKTQAGHRCPAFWRLLQTVTSTTKLYVLEVEVVRVRITLACTECKQRNYNMTKEKKNHPERMETKKYCKFCRTHTLHKETK